MSGNYAFVVLLPNARRANVKGLTTNTTILEVLEDVCRKHELNPEQFDLTHHNKVIDLHNSIRYAGIPNNATLEMVAVSKTRVESPVNLNLVLESGKRLNHQFYPKQTLWEVLQFFKSEPGVLPETPDDSLVLPVCIYMRQEVVGRADLEKKTLRSLGLTKGSALIRLVHRTESSLRTQANVSAPLSKATVVAPEPEPMEVGEAPPQALSKATAPAAPPKTETMPLNLSKKSPSPPPQPKVVPPYPTPPNPTPGPSRATPGSSSAPAAPPTGTVEQSQGLSTHFSPPEVKNAQRYSKPGDFNILGPRDTLLYHGDDVIVSQSDVDDSFFDLSLNEVKKMYAELQKKSLALENAPLTTKSAKDLEKDSHTLRILHDHPHTVVRIRFPNRYVLQGVFRTVEKVGAIYSWLRPLLKDPTLQFYLFTTPPKKILGEELALLDEGLVGMAVIYFGSGSTEGEESFDVLKPEFYEKLSAPDAVYDFIHKKLKKEMGVAGGSVSTGNGSGSDSLPIHESEIDRKPPPPQRQPAPVVKGDGKLPKWFKTGK